MSDRNVDLSALCLSGGGIRSASFALGVMRADVDAVGHFEPYGTHTPTAVDAPGRAIDFTRSVLKRTENSAGRDPFLVVKVDKKLIADHDDIWRPGIRSFITHLILISSQSSDMRERTEHRQAVAK